MKGKHHCKILLCYISILFLFGIIPNQAVAKEQPDNTIRVGYPIQSGLSMRDKNGNLSGYSYDYLMEISQYTGWNYEFVFIEGSLNKQLTTMMEMLEKGQIDIMGALYYDESLTDVYSYPGYCYGMNYSGLFVPRESKLRESSLYNYKNIRVVYIISITQKLNYWNNMRR